MGLNKKRNVSIFVDTAGWTRVSGSPKKQLTEGTRQQK